MSGGEEDNGGASDSGGKSDDPTVSEEIKDIADELRDSPPATPEQAKEIADHLREIAREIREGGEGNDTSDSDYNPDPYNH